MKWMSNIFYKGKGFFEAVLEYPITAFFLLLSSAIFVFEIHSGGDYEVELFTSILGALVGVVLKAFFDRFLKKARFQFIGAGVTLLLVCGYYSLFRIVPQQAMRIRSLVLFFLLFLVFLWIPTNRQQLPFSKVFSDAFQAFFQTLLYAVVLFLGMLLVIFTFDQLVFSLDENIYSYVATMVFVLFSPLFFLSLLPDYQKKEFPHFFDILLTYVIIPLSFLFTAILYLYIGKNMITRIWNDTRMEPILVSYGILILILYFLASEEKGKSAHLFRFLAPKLLIPIALYQIAVSTLVMQEGGLTVDRYFVLLFGIFAVVSGVLASFIKREKNSILAGILICFTLVSFVPPLDAVSVSIRSQKKRLESLLETRGMLANQVLLENTELSTKDKEQVVSALTYILELGYGDSLTWLLKDFQMERDFETVFGFSAYDVPQKEWESVSVARSEAALLSIAEYDFFIRFHCSLGQKDSEIGKVQTEQGKYVLWIRTIGGEQKIVLVDEMDEELLSFSITQIRERYLSYSTDFVELAKEDAQFLEENERVKLLIGINQGNFNKGGDDFYYMDGDLFLEIK
ncbi:MAG: hypothetical protein PWP24_1633 [Clostridiales bacterium]|nr:hypothetical protein [Clostridiales bacterium]